MEENNKQQEPKIKLPRNVRQIGTIDKDSIIYMEDYVVTYLRQMIKKEGLLFGAAALYGRTVFQGKEKYVFVSGAVFAEDKPTEKSGSQDIIENGPTKSMISTFRENAEKYFPDLDPVGIAILHNENKSIPKVWLHKQKMLSFVGRGSVLITMNTEEKEPEIFQYKEDGMESKAGYYIYYDKNEVMQSFLVEWHEGEQSRIDGEKEDFAAGTCRMVLNDRKENRSQEKANSYMSASSLLMLIAACIVGIVIINHYNGVAGRTPTDETLPVAANLPENQEELLQDNSESEMTSQEFVEGSYEALLSENQAVEEESDTVISENTVEPESGEQIREEISAEEPGEEFLTEESDGNTEEVAQVQAEATQSMGMVEYVIEKGDTLESISRRYYGDISRVAEICELNNIEDRDNIYYGQRIILP